MNFPENTCNTDNNGMQEITKICEGRCCFFNATNYSVGEVANIRTQPCNYICSKLQYIFSLLQPSCRTTFHRYLKIRKKKNKTKNIYNM